MNTSRRSRARELVLQTLYAVECGAAQPDDDFTSIIDDEKLPTATTKYARDLLTLLRTHSDWANQQIARLALNWKAERIATIDRCILRQALVELEYVVDVPVKVVINEAIELAKKFSTPQSSAFVNGILDAFAKEGKRDTAAN